MATHKNVRGSYEPQAHFSFDYEFFRMQSLEIAGNREECFQASAMNADHDRR